MQRRFRIGCFTTAVVVATISTARAQSDPAPPFQTIGQQLIRLDPAMAAVRFNILLDFEKPSDTVFIRAEGADAERAPDVAHTGSTSLGLPAGVTSLRVNLASLMTGRAFPGDWGLIGAYFRTDGDVDVTVEYIRQGKPAATRTVHLEKGAWTRVVADVAAVTLLAQSGQVDPADGLSFTFAAKDAARVWCDDVIIINNTQVLADGGADRLTVKRTGLGYVIGRPRAYGFRLPAGDQPGAVTAIEAGPLRAVFRAVDGKTFCFYADGRALADGQQMLKGREAYDRYQTAQDHPARIEVFEELGRLDRTTPGDANNDGFNELRGAYVVKGSAGGVDVTLEPTRGIPMLRPVLEIAGLGDGKVTASVEGRAVDDIARLPDGRALIILPVDIQRRTTIEVRVQ